LTLQSLPKAPFKKQPVVPARNDYEPDESFKTASNSFLDATTEHLSSYDITLYEDLDDDLKHRENKTIPNWAADSKLIPMFYIIHVSHLVIPSHLVHLLNQFLLTFIEASLQEALFSMVYLAEYQYKIASGFPKPDKSFKLFPSRNY